MKTALIAIASSAVTGGICYIAGSWRTADKIQKKLIELEPLLKTMVTDMIVTAADQRMTPEQIKAYGDEQLSFLKIIAE